MFFFQRLPSLVSNPRDIFTGSGVQGEKKVDFVAISGMISRQGEAFFLHDDRDSQHDFDDDYFILFLPQDCSNYHRTHGEHDK